MSPEIGKETMNPFDLFRSPGIYKVAVLYFSRSRGLAIIGRGIQDNNVEVLQISGEVDPRTGNFTALDYPSPEKRNTRPVITRKDFDKLLSFIASRIDEQTRMSVIEPEVMQSLLADVDPEEPAPYLH
ncbi:MAG: hypothetical protein AB1473_23405 [Thermodesulfobacteriota bacterium]